MAMVTIDLPEELIPAHYSSPEEFIRATRVAAAMFRYSRAEVSHGIAAMIAGMSRAEFIDALAAAKVDAFQVDFDELDRELERDRLANREHLPADFPDEGGVARHAARSGG